MFLFGPDPRLIGPTVTSCSSGFLLSIKYPFTFNQSVCFMQPAWKIRAKKDNNKPVLVMGMSWKKQCRRVAA